MLGNKPSPVSTSTSPILAQALFRRVIFLAVLFVASSALAFIALLVPFSVFYVQAPLEVGDVASQDFRAPANISYDSQVLTDEQRRQVAMAVEPVYSPIDTNVARHQLERLRVALSFTTTIRVDSYASMEQKLADLAALEDVRLDQTTSQTILEMSSSRWQAIQQESIVVLEQVMRTTIRDSELETTRRSVPYYVSLVLSEEQASLVVKLVSAFVMPNSFYDESATQLARQRAQAAVTPIEKTYMTGETILLRGQVITPLSMEALTEAGLVQPKVRWQEITGAGVLVALTMLFLVVYFWRKPLLTEKPRKLLVFAVLYLGFLFGARLLIPGHTVLPYLFPIASYGLLILALFGVELALVTVVPLTLMVTYALPLGLPLMAYYLLTSWFGVFMIGRAQRFTRYVWTGVMLALAGVGIVFAFRFPDPTMDWSGISTLALAAVVYGVASASVTLMLQFFLAQFTGTTTALQLMELSRPDRPLLQLLLSNAPGTYQHSLQVANLVEHAAERIGADTLLVRVGALYHDIGKIESAAFFIENQVPGNLNPHDDLDPMISSTVIIQHVVKGLALARKHHLPQLIQNFISEHHGTMLTHYQYNRAVQLNGGNQDQVNSDDFRYPGPRPQSRETALVMLADGCEAHVRAEHPKDEGELRKLIKHVVEQRVALGQLDDTELTLHDLEEVVDSFTGTLRGIYHPRIQYPTLEKHPASSEKVITLEPASDNLPSSEVRPLKEADSASPLS